MFNIFLNFIFFMLELGLHCCMWAFCSFIEQGLLSNCGVQASYCSGFSCRGTQPLGTQASVVAACGL